jgi:hypothetical protein
VRTPNLKPRIIKEVLEIEERRLPPEWNGIIPVAVFLEEAQRVVQAARDAGFTLRLLGGVAVRLHCAHHEALAQRLGRAIRESGLYAKQQYYDLDFVALKAQRKQLPFFFDDLGYIKRRTTLATAASERHIYFHPDGWFEADIFFDKMLMEHSLPLAHRLDLDFPTIPVTDLLLSKLLITAFTEKDLKDVFLLLRAHELSEHSEPDKVNVNYIARLLVNDWGFWYDVVTNLRRVQRHARNSSLLEDSDRSDLAEKTRILLERVHSAPKTLRWRWRALLGTRKQWYTKVEE